MRFTRQAFGALLCLGLVLGWAGSTFAQDASATTVLVAESADLGPYLTDSEGMTLYLFTNDTEPNVSVCEGDCLANWPAFTAEEPLTLPEGVGGELTSFTRADGTTQVAYNGVPLYYFAGAMRPRARPTVKASVMSGTSSHQSQPKKWLRQPCLSVRIPSSDRS